MAKITLRLGTRRSLLARTQSSWVARCIEETNPGVTVELVGIETEGDRIVDIPLRKAEGREFFVKELDDALLGRRIDLSVHSLKDLSLERPTELVQAAVPRREDPRDIVVFNSFEGPLRIGTSSPRRLENLPAFLSQALPAPSGPEPRHLEWVEIRGNVNTRLARLHEPKDSERFLNGVVLALAGITRLWRDPESRKELEPLMQGLRWMVVPATESPSAPGQGALSVECRRDRQDVYEIIRKIHDEPSAHQVERERAVLREFGGGCHQRFGATAIDHDRLGPVLWIRGKTEAGAPLDLVRWREPLFLKRSEDVVSWDGQKMRAAGAHHSMIPELSELKKRQAVFVAHWRAMPKQLLYRFKQAEARIWTSGFKSWAELARAGLWVEGASESLGFNSFVPLIENPALGLPPLEDWLILTHVDGADSWPEGRVIPTYRVTPHYPEETRERLRRATHVFWSSGSQYRALKSLVRPDAVHACGPGKTGDELERAGLKPILFPNVELWRGWIERNTR